MEKNFKLSNYLDPFIEAANKANEHNYFIKHGKEVLKKHHKYWSEEKVEKEFQYMLSQPPYNKGLVEVPHVPTQAELEQKFGGNFKYYEILAKIGNSGKEVHKVEAYALKTKDGYILWNAFSHCGSRKWNIKNPSGIFPIESADLNKVTCDKCLGIRVKGGKEENKPSQYKCQKCGYTNNRSAFEYGNYAVKRYKCPKCQAYINSISKLRVTNEAQLKKETKFEEAKFEEAKFKTVNRSTKHRHTTKKIDQESNISIRSIRN